MLGFNLNSQMHRPQSMWSHVVASRADLHVVMQFLVSPERSLLQPATRPCERGRPFLAVWNRV